jgi:hypothetical protein
MIQIWKKYRFFFWQFDYSCFDTQHKSGTSARVTSIFLDKIVCFQRGITKQRCHFPLSQTFSFWETIKGFSYKQNKRSKLKKNYKKENNWWRISLACLNQSIPNFHILFFLENGYELLCFSNHGLTVWWIICIKSRRK